MTYRELKKQLNAAFDNVDNSTMDNQVAIEDIIHLQNILSKETEGFIY